MFLLTFALVIISMLSVYTQVYAVETARLFSNQTGVAQSMIVWHAAAASLVANVVPPASAATATGCSLNYGAAGLCPIGAGYSSIGTVMGGVAVTGLYANTLGMEFPNFPPGYVLGSFQWNSIAYDPDPYYVITYVSYTASGTGATAASPITTATGKKLNITEGDLYRQLQQSGIPPYSFGYVSNPPGGPATLVAGPSISNSATVYPVPTTIPDGSLAIISVPGQCNGC
jgi:hypothetical protein